MKTSELMNERTTQKMPTYLITWEEMTTEAGHTAASKAGPSMAVVTTGAHVCGEWNQPPYEMKENVVHVPHLLDGQRICVIVEFHHCAL